METALGTPREAWLDPDGSDRGHARFGVAMMRCQHGGGFCAQDGFCHHDGDCFRSARSAAREAARIIRHFTCDSDLVRAQLNDAADFLERQARGA